ncbi:MAG TPA: hypothetical protein VK066_00450 [Chloroflexota bacterium]|nr:hypothetical protein [Chloroflexota bacterium]
MQKLDVMIARLRLLLADIAAKEQQLNTLRRQLREQLERLVTYSVYGDAEVDRSLALMADVEQRLAQADLNARHLQRIRERAERELESLLLTKGVEEAKARLAALHEQKAQVEEALRVVAAPGAPQVDLASAAKLQETESALDDEIRRLQHDINEASERAARTIEARPR